MKTTKKVLVARNKTDGTEETLKENMEVLSRVSAYRASFKGDTTLWRKFESRLIGTGVFETADKKVLRTVPKKTDVGEKTEAWYPIDGMVDILIELLLSNSK